MARLLVWYSNLWPYDNSNDNLYDELMISWVGSGFNDDYYVLSVTYFLYIVEIHDLGIILTHTLWECSLRIYHLVIIIATLIYKHDILFSIASSSLQDSITWLPAHLEDKMWDGVKVMCHSHLVWVGFWGFHPYMHLFSFRKFCDLFLWYGVECHIRLHVCLFLIAAGQPTTTDDWGCGMQYCGLGISSCSMNFMQH